MSGPIVRTGTSRKYGDNWDKIFGEGGGKKAAAPSAAKKAAAPKAAKKAVKKAAKKKK